MERAFFFLSLKLAAVLFVAPAVADDPGKLPIPPGWKQKEVHDPSHPRGVDFQPNGLARRGTRGDNVTPPLNGNGRRRGDDKDDNVRIVFYPGWGYGGYNWGWYGRPYYYDYDPFGPYYGGVIYGGGPIFLPAEELYGLGPILRMFGRYQTPRQPIPNVVHIEIPDPKPAPVRKPPAAAKPAAPAVNRQGANGQAADEQARDRAAKFMQFGNQHFARQAYLAANDSFKNAADADPRNIEAHFRRAASLLALRQYVQAAKVYQRAITLDPAWARTPFRLRDLYGRDDELKQAHIDALAETVAENPDDALLNLGLAMTLFLDDQEERSRPFFEHYVALSGRRELFPPENDQPPAAAAPPAVKPPAEARGAQNGRVADF